MKIKQLNVSTNVSDRDAHLQMLGYGTTFYLCIIYLH
jgi:hypothetical protein